MKGTVSARLGSKVSLDVQYPFRECMVSTVMNFITWDPCRLSGRQGDSAVVCENVGGRLTWYA